MRSIDIKEELRRMTMDMVKVTGLLGRVTRCMMVVMMIMVMVVVIMKMTGKGPVGTRHRVVGDYDDI